MTEPQLDVGGDGETLPTEEVLTGRGFAFGKSGYGKSNSASVVIEELLEDGHACLVVDTDGEYYGLKDTYEVVHATGDDEGDLRVGPEHADHLAELAIEENVPVILDVSSFLDPDDADQLVGKVARALFAKAKKLRKPFLLVVEECHEYIPQQGSPGFAGQHITRIAKRGRKHGLGLLGISQRPANVDKDAVTQANWITWHRLTFKNDTSLVRDLYGAEVAAAIEDLEKGEAFLYADWIEDLQRFRWRRKRTFDAGETPGLDETERPELRSIDQEVLEQLQEAGDAARTKEDRIEALEDELEEARERIEELEHEKEQLEDRNAWEEQMASRMFDGLETGPLELDLSGEGSIRADVMEVYEERQELEDETDRLQDELEERDERISELEATVAELEEYRERVDREEDLHQLRDDLRELVLDRYPDVFDAEADERVDQLRERLEEKDDRLQDLEGELERLRTGRTPTPEPEGFEEILERLRTDAVQETVAKATRIKSDNSSEETVWQTLVALARAPNPPVHATELLGSVPVESKETVSRILAALEDVELATSTRGDHNRKLYQLDLDGLERVIQRKAEDERVSELAGDLITEGSP